MFLPNKTWANDPIWLQKSRKVRCCYSSLQCWAPMAPRCGIGTWDERPLGWRGWRLFTTGFMGGRISLHQHYAPQGITRSSSCIVVLADSFEWIELHPFFQESCMFSEKKTSCIGVDFHKPKWNLWIKQDSTENCDICFFFPCLHMPTPPPGGCLRRCAGIQRGEELRCPWITRSVLQPSTHAWELRWRCWDMVIQQKRCM